MSRIESIFCDLCGHEINKYNQKDHSAQIKLCAPGEYRGNGQRIDLCLFCYKLFTDFLETRENVKEEGE